MIETAKSKIRTEMQSATGNTYVQAVGEYLLYHLDQYPADADKICATDKTIAKSLEAMRTEAQKKKSGNCAVIAPQEGFSIVLKYFGIDRAPASIGGVTRESITVTPPIEKPPARVPTDFDVRLEDLL